MRKLIMILLGLAMSTITTMAQNKLAVEIVKENDVPVLKINGKEHVPEIIYHTLETSFRSFPNVLGKGINPSAELIKLAKKHDFHLTTMPMPLVWPKDGKPADYSEIDRIMDKHIELDSKVMTMPRLLGMPPAWWLKENPSELMKFETSTGRELSPSRLREVARYASPTSKKWRKDYYNALRSQIRHLEQKYGNYILGYHPGIQSCGENFFALAWDRVNPTMAGFSESFRQGFIEYVEKKYKSIGKVNNAWQTTLTSFSDIKVPTMKERIDGESGTFRDPEKQRFIIDFMTYFQLPIAEVAIDTAKIIKEETNYKKLVLFFYGSPQAGHSPLNPAQRGVLALDLVLKCPEIDIICNPYDYRNRQHGGTGLVGNMLDSIITHGKMYFVEDDTRSHTAPFKHFGKTQNMQESKEVFVRLLPQLLQYNLGRWYMDFGSGYNVQPELFELFEKMRKVRESFKTEPFRPEVALVFDTESSFYLRGSNEVSIHFFNMMFDYPLMGAPFGRYLLSDVCAGKVPKETKVLFFFNAYKIDEQQRKELHKVLAAGRKTAVWFYAPGYIDGKKADVANIQRLTGIAVERISSPMRSEFKLNKELPGLKKGHNFGVKNTINTMFTIVKDQPGVDYLADYVGIDYAGMASKQMGEWKSILFCGLRFGPEMFRALAKDSNVHIYCDSNDSISASSNFIAINAISDGEKTLYFKKKVDLSDSFTGEKVASGVEQYTLDMKKGQTRIFLKKNPSGFH
ncbi:MAG: beta-galactosidase [Victivallaceae bacterium]